jgi:CheY-like chemotaxis protein
MEITCGSCFTTLSVSDSILPKGVPVVRSTCPKCKAPIEIKLPAAAAVPAAAPAAAAPAPAPEPAPAPAPAPAPTNGHAAPDRAQGEEVPAPKSVSNPAEPVREPDPAPAPAPAPRPMPAAAPAPMTPMLDEEFAEGQKLALACFSDDAARSSAKSELEGLGYSVHAPQNGAEALARFRKTKYELVLIQEGYGAPDADLHKAVSVMAMPARRHACVGLIGGYRTMDNMAAFAKSVNFVVSDKELGKLKSIVRHAVADNNQFYAIFHDALKEAHKA